MRAFVDSNVLVRHLTGDPPGQAAAATAFLASADEIHLADVVLAEVVYVLESYYRVPRNRVAALARAIVGFRAMVVEDDDLLLRALEVYELDRLHFAEAYLVARAERSAVGVIASSDRSIDRIPSVRRLQPSSD